MFSTMLSLLGSLRRGNFVANSLRFRSSGLAFLSKAFSTPTNSTVFTWSGWVKRGNVVAAAARLFSAGTNTSLGFNSSDQLTLTLGGTAAVATTAVYRDFSAWYHIVYAQNGAAQTLYVNGSSVGTGTTANTAFNTAIAHQLGAANNLSHFDGYLTEVHFIDGQALTPSSFGQIESTTGVWSPKQYVGTYGINGFYLKFSNATEPAALGADSSGNGNTWAVNNVLLTPGVLYDSMLDVPVNYSDNGNGRGNYAVLNPLKNGGLSISNANLTVNQAAASWANTRSTIQIPVGSKFYCEFVSATSYTANNVSFLGLANQSLSLTASAGDVANIYTTTTSGEVLRLAVDRVNNTCTTYRNNTQVGTASISPTADLEVVVGCYQAGGSVNFGQRQFAYTPPSGFLALNTQNMPTPTIVNGASYIAATAYTGTAGVQSLSNVVNGVSFQPDFVWIKSRTPDTSNHALFDSVRGTGKYLSSNTTGEEVTNANTLTDFNGDGFSLGTDTTIVNQSGTSYIAWQWKESVTAGLDVVAYTGTGVTRTVSHNLGVAPTFIIVKRLQVAGTSFQVRHPSIDVGNTMRLNLTDEFLADATIWGGSLPNASNFTVGTNASVNGSGSNYIAYCFAEVEGFSKFGNYIGNGSTNGPFVYCGFKPKFVIYKSFSGGDNSSWQIFDSTRDVFNPTDENLSANGVTNNTSGPYIDILSNGFKLRTASTGHNASGAGYIFVAFAEVPSKYALAR